LLNVSVNSLEQLANGDWLVAATDLTAEGYVAAYALRHLGADGTVVAELGGGPINPVQNTRLIPLANGRILIGGETPMLSQVQRNGFLDLGFKPIWGEYAEDPFVSAIARSPDGRVLVAANRVGAYLTQGEDPPGGLTWPGQYVFRVLPDGMMDLSFDFSAVAGEIPRQMADIALQPDGKFITADGQKLRRFIETPSPPVFAFGEKTVTVNEDDRFATLTVYRAGDVQTRGSVMFETVQTGSTAIPWRDYWPIHLRIRFDSGHWKRTVFVPLRDDHVADSTKRIVVRLSHPDPHSVLYSTSSATIEILDDE
jgi:hypothetical protein